MCKNVLTQSDEIGPFRTTGQLTWVVAGLQDNKTTNSRSMDTRRRPTGTNLIILQGTTGSPWSPSGVLPRSLIAGDTLGCRQIRTCRETPWTIRLDELSSIVELRPTWSPLGYSLMILAFVRAPTSQGPVYVVTDTTGI